MASDGQSSGSAQQPFAHPQPAPAPIVPYTTTAPPTKAGLKSWWRNFSSKETAKPAETQGTIPYLLPGSKFHETSILEYSPVASGKPDIGECDAYIGAEKYSLRKKAVKRIEGSKSEMRRSCLSFHDPSLDLLVDTGYTSSGSKRPSSQLFNLPFVRATSTPLGAGKAPSIMPRSSSRLSLTPQKQLLVHKRKRFSVIFRHTLKMRRFAKLAAAVVNPPGPGIFGVPLRQSITYANVAISLVDNDGNSYIYGYVPIVVAKCGVFLKEKGEFACLKTNLIITLMFVSDQC